MKMLEAGIDAHSASPWASPLLLMRKKYGSLRICIDYKNLNQIMKRDAHHIPRIANLVVTLSCCKYFTKLDLASGYDQVEVNEEHEEKTGFAAPFRFF